MCRDDLRSRYCWGSDGDGQLGNGPGLTVTQVAPSAVVTPAGVVWASIITIGNGAACGLSTVGDAYCWGPDTFGLQGNGAATGSQRSPGPIAAPAGVTWSSIAGGGLTVCGITVGGATYCWGLNGDGELGIGTIGGAAEAPVLVNPGPSADTDGDGLTDDVDSDDDNDGVADGADALPARRHGVGGHRRRWDRGQRRPG